MKEYINGLYARLEELSEKPLTLGRIEEADAVAGPIMLHGAAAARNGNTAPAIPMAREHIGGTHSLKRKR